jgi:hypothetical protein
VRAAGVGKRVPLRRLPSRPRSSISSGHNPAPAIPCLARGARPNRGNPSSKGTPFELPDSSGERPVLRPLTEYRNDPAVDRSTDGLRAVGLTRHDGWPTGRIFGLLESSSILPHIGRSLGLVSLIPGRDRGPSLLESLGWHCPSPVRTPSYPFRRAYPESISSGLVTGN